MFPADLQPAETADNLIVSRERFGEDAKSLLKTRPELRGIILERYDSIEEFSIPNVEIVHKPAYSLNLYAAMGLCEGFERDDSADEAELSFTAQIGRASCRERV